MMGLEYEKYKKMYVEIEFSKTVCQIAHRFANSFYACQKPQKMRHKQ